MNTMTDEESLEFKAVFDSCPEGILIVDGEGKKFLQGNTAICRMLGYNAEELKNLGVTNIHTQKDLPYVLDQFERQAKGEIKISRDLPVKRNDGSVFYADVSSTTVSIAGKMYLVGFFHDTTGRKKVEQELSLSQQFLNNVIEQSPVSLWISDNGGTMVQMNQACRDLFGVTDAEGVGKYNLLKDNVIEKQGFMPLVKNVFEKGEVARFTIDYDLPQVEHVNIKHGTHTILDVIISPIKDIHGTLTNCLIQHRDITEQKKLEEDLKERVSELELMNKSMIDRELKMVELKKQIEDLQKRLATKS